MHSVNVAFVTVPTLPVSILKDSRNVHGEALLSFPLGVLYLSSYLKANVDNVNVNCIDFLGNIDQLQDAGTVENYITSVAHSSLSFDPDIIAISVVFSTGWEFTEIALRDLRRLWPSATIILGGAHVTSATAMVFENECVDYIARGEGEMAFVEFVEKFRDNESLDIKGIYDREKFGGRGPVMELGQYPDDLDVLPHPDWELVEIERYINAGRSRKRNFGTEEDLRMATIMTSRGCPFKCTFCASHTVHGRSMRYHSDEYVLEEIKTLQERYGVKLVIPEDDLFTVNKRRIIPLLEKIHALSIPGLELQFPNALSINTLDEDVIDALATAGMKIATVAIESGSEYVQTHIIKKRCNLEKAKRLVKYIRSKGLFCRAYFILGFPGETVEQMEETYEFAKDLGADWCTFYAATPLLGSEMYDQFIERGAFSETDRYWEDFYSKRTFDTEEISAKDLNAMAYRNNILVNFTNNVNLREEKWARAEQLFDDVINAFPFHVIGLYYKSICREESGDADKAALLRCQILERIDTDARSKDLYEKFPGLFNGLHSRLNFDSRAQNSTRQLPDIHNPNWSTPGGAIRQRTSS